MLTRWLVQRNLANTMSSNTKTFSAITGGGGEGGQSARKVSEFATMVFAPPLVLNWLSHPEVGTGEQ